MRQIIFMLVFMPTICLAQVGGQDKQRPCYQWYDLNGKMLCSSEGAGTGGSGIKIICSAYVDCKVLKIISCVDKDGVKTLCELE